MRITVQLNGACAGEPMLLWDTIWDAQAGEGKWALAGPDETLNRGGLAATQPLHTAVVLCLFTDKRAPPELESGGSGPGGFPPRLDDGDPRGWWGDGIDVRAEEGETALGSHLWLLFRAPLDAVQIPRLAMLYAQEALQPLIDQRACVRVDVRAQTDEARGHLELFVDLYGQDGARIYDGRFDIYWRSI